MVFSWINYIAYKFTKLFSITGEPMPQPVTLKKLKLNGSIELTPQKDVLFIIGDWNAKVGSQETSGVTGKFGFGVQNEAGQMLIEFCQENAMVIANNLFQ